MFYKILLKCSICSLKNVENRFYQAVAKFTIEGKHIESKDFKRVVYK